MAEDRAIIARRALLTQSQPSYAFIKAAKLLSQPQDFWKRMPSFTTKATKRRTLLTIHLSQLATCLPIGFTMGLDILPQQFILPPLAPCLVPSMTHPLDSAIPITDGQMHPTPLASAAMIIPILFLTCHQKPSLPLATLLSPKKSILLISRATAPTIMATVGLRLLHHP